MSDLYINVNYLMDILECMQDANKNDVVRQTIDEVIDVVYDIAEQKEQE